MKRIVQGIALAALFAVSSQLQGWVSDNTKQTAAKAGMIAGFSSLGILALIEFKEWLAQPTSKNLFAIANEFEKTVTQVKQDINTITKKKIAPDAFLHIKNLMSELCDLIYKYDGNNATLINLLRTENALPENKTRQYATIRGNEKEVHTILNMETIYEIITEIKKAAEKVQKNEQERSKKSWFSKQAWKNWWNKGKTTATNNQKEDKN